MPALLFSKNQEWKQFHFLAKQKKSAEGGKFAYDTQVSPSCFYSCVEVHLSYQDRPECTFSWVCWPPMTVPSASYPAGFCVIDDNTCSGDVWARRAVCAGCEEDQCAKTEEHSLGHDDNVLGALPFSLPRAVRYLRPHPMHGVESPLKRQSPAWRKNNLFHNSSPLALHACPSWGGETRKRVKSSRCSFCARQSVRNDLGPHGHGGPHRGAVLIRWQCR